VSAPYELPFRNKEASLDDLKTALPNQYANEGCPSDLLDVAKQFAQTCDGLPLALVVLGGLLIMLLIVIKRRNQMLMIIGATS
jgi:hypothetical protein